MTYARTFIIGLLAAQAFCVNGGLPMYIFYGLLAAHFTTKSAPWGFEKLKVFAGDNVDGIAQRCKTIGKIC